MQSVFDFITHFIATSDYCTYFKRYVNYVLVLQRHGALINLCPKARQFGYNDKITLARPQCKAETSSDYK